MAYVLSYSLGSIIVNDTTLNNQTSLGIPGLNYEPYGAPVDQNFVWLLENFAAPNQPANPIPGQTWYNTGTKTLNLNISDNLNPAWVPLNENLNPGGPNNSIQYNSDEVFTGSSSLTFDPVVGLMTVDGNVVANYFIGDGGLLSNISANSISNGYSNSNVANYLPTYTGNLLSINRITAAGNIISQNANLGNAARANFFVGDGGLLSNISANSIINNYSNSNVANYLPIFPGNIASVNTITATGNITANRVTANLLTGSLTTAAQSNITSVGTLTSLAVSGTLISGTTQTTQLTTGSAAAAGTITGTWTLSAGSTLRATYADLAEKYVADQAYPAGTVLEFGGSHEVTLAQDETRRVAGVVSTDPAYVMNDGCLGDHVVLLAMIGRVPCRVRGTIHKGDLLCSAGDGYARPTHSPKVGTIIGKALEDYDGVDGVIEIVVGKV